MARDCMVWHGMAWHGMRTATHLRNRSNLAPGPSSASIDISEGRLPYRFRASGPCMWHAEGGMGMGIGGNQHTMRPARRMHTPRTRANMEHADDTATPNIQLSRAAPIVAPTGASKRVHTSPSNVHMHSMLSGTVLLHTHPLPASPRVLQARPLPRSGPGRTLMPPAPCSARFALPDPTQHLMINSISNNCEFTQHFHYLTVFVWKNTPGN